MIVHSYQHLYWSISEFLSVTLHKNQDGQLKNASHHQAGEIFIEIKCFTDINQKNYSNIAEVSSQAGFATGNCLTNNNQ